MPIDELITELERIKDEFGNIDVYAWSKELKQRKIIDDVTVAVECETMKVVDLEFI